MARELRSYYEIWTYDDIDHEEPSESGEAFTLLCEPDAYDLEDGKTAVDLAFGELQDHGPFEPSSSDFHPGVWYSDTDGSHDYRTGTNTRHSYHLAGFSEDEERELYTRLTAKD